MTFNDFMHMGGYGIYLWPAYFLTALVLIGFLVSSYWQFKQCFKALTPKNRSSTNNFMKGFVNNQIVSKEEIG